MTQKFSFSVGPILLFLFLLVSVSSSAQTSMYHRVINVGSDKATAMNSCNSGAVGTELNYNFYLSSAIPVGSIIEAADFRGSISYYYVSFSSSIENPNFNLFRGDLLDLDVCEVSPGPGENGPQLSESSNYIISRTYQNANSSTTGAIEQVVHYDGLGRPSQSVAVKAGGNQEDLITPIVYDIFGRQLWDYQPVPKSDGGAGAFRTDILADAEVFYESKFPEDFQETVNPYSEKDLEPSPIGRLLRKAAPGSAWKMGNGKEIEFAYSTNVTNEVRLYQVDLILTGGVYEPTLVLNGSYAPGELLKTITYDENNSNKSKAHSVEEFKDKGGRMVLKRTYADTDQQAQEPHDTYYVYDDFGNLTYVLPPKAEPQTATPDLTELNELCFQYKYDTRNRLAEKKIPGKGWEYIVYNKIDQPVLTQDANLRIQGKWLLTKYDGIGRIVYTGMVNSSNTRSQYQDILDGGITLFEKRSVAEIIGGTTLYYTSNSLPTAVNELFTINYYDDYNVNIGFSIPSTNAFGDSISRGISTKGLTTLTKVKVLGTTSWITTAMGYDSKKHIIWTKTVNPFLEVTEIVEYDLDFSGNILQSKTTHQKANKGDIVIRDYFEYDHMNRLEKHTQSINGTPGEVIAENHYDQLGQLVKKGVGNPEADTLRLQNIHYSYNVRGWLKQINDPATLGTDLFGFKINYNSVDHNGTPLYNGNIAETEWKTQNDNVLRWYRYGYDHLNRITSATANSSNYNLSGVAYDKNGNIINLTRRGATNAAATSFGDMDILTYEYSSDSNKLISVNDMGETNFGFKDASSLSTHYNYDTNGNLTSDANKGITIVVYNHLNMPSEIKFNNSNTQKIIYTYSADGIKLRKATNNGGAISTTDYAGNFIYENNLLKLFYQPEGYVEPKSSSWQYVYQYKDIWRNTRITYADDNNSGSATNAEIRREQNYYPFGLEHKGYNFASYGAKNNLKTYQGQEFTEDLGLNTHEWKYRMSDPSIGRFWQLDPLAEKYYYNSTYAFQENKLGSGIELEGLENVKFDKLGDHFTQQAQSSPPLTAQQKQNFKNVVHGFGNVIFGTVGAIGSGVYIAGTGGTGAAVGGAVAMTFSITEIGIGIGQITDAMSNNSSNVPLHKSSSLPGLVANQNGSENAELIDAAGQFFPGMLSGGNLRTIVEEGGNILKSNSTLLGTAGAFDAAMDTNVVIEAAANTLNTSTSTSQANVQDDNNTIPPLIPPVSSELEGNNFQ